MAGGASERVSDVDGPGATPSPRSQEPVIRSHRDLRPVLQVESDPLGLSLDEGWRAAHRHSAVPVEAENRHRGAPGGQLVHTGLRARQGVVEPRPRRHAPPAGHEQPAIKARRGRDLVGQRLPARGAQRLRVRQQLLGRRAAQSGVDHQVIVRRPTANDFRSGSCGPWPVCTRRWRDCPPSAVTPPASRGRASVICPIRGEPWRSRAVGLAHMRKTGLPSVFHSLEHDEAPGRKDAEASGVERQDTRNGRMQWSQTQTPPAVMLAQGWARRFSQ